MARNKDIARILDEEGAAAEDAEADQTDRPLPDNVKVSQPGRARSKVLQVRLNPEEYEALERIAARRDVPVSAVARGELLKLIEAERATEHGGAASRLILLLNRAHEIREFAADLDNIRNRIVHHATVDSGERFLLDLGFPDQDVTKLFLDAAPSCELDEDHPARQVGVE